MVCGERKQPDWEKGEVSEGANGSIVRAEAPLDIEVIPEALIERISIEKARERNGPAALWIHKNIRDLIAERVRTRRR